MQLLNEQLNEDAWHKRYGTEIMRYHEHDVESCRSYQVTWARSLGTISFEIWKAPVRPQREKQRRSSKMDTQKKFKPFLLCHEDGGFPARLVGESDVRSWPPTEEMMFELERQDGDEFCDEVVDIKSRFSGRAVHRGCRVRLTTHRLSWRAEGHNSWLALRLDAIESLESCSGVLRSLRCMLKLSSGVPVYVKSSSDPVTQDLLVEVRNAIVKARWCDGSFQVKRQLEELNIPESNSVEINSDGKIFLKASVEALPAFKEQDWVYSIDWAEAFQVIDQLHGRRPQTMLDSKRHGSKGSPTRAFDRLVMQQKAGHEGCHITDCHSLNFLTKVYGVLTVRERPRSFAPGTVYRPCASGLQRIAIGGRCFAIYLTGGSTALKQRTMSSMPQLCSKLQGSTSMFDWRCVQRMEKLAGSEDLVWKAAKPMLQVYIPLKACDAFGPRERVLGTHSHSSDKSNELSLQAGNSGKHGSPANAAANAERLARFNFQGRDKADKADKATRDKADKVTDKVTGIGGIKGGIKGLREAARQAFDELDSSCFFYIAYGAYGMEKHCSCSY
eukprot:s1543_g13.t1